MRNQHTSARKIIIKRVTYIKISSGVYRSTARKVHELCIRINSKFPWRPSCSSVLRRTVFLRPYYTRTAMIFFFPFIIIKTLNFIKNFHFPHRCLLLVLLVFLHDRERTTRGSYPQEPSTGRFSPVFPVRTFVRRQNYNKNIN